MNKWHIYFWEPSVSPHKLDLVQALTHSPAVEAIFYIAEEGLSAERKAQGWSLPALPSVNNMVVSPSKETVKEIIKTSSPESLHIFSGIHWVPCVVEGIASAIDASRRFGIMSEPRAFEGIKGWARFAHSWLTEGHVRAHSNFILAIGRNGPPWFRVTGYKWQKIFPFAYFLPSTAAANKPVPSENTKTCSRVTFLGRITKEKGIHLFLEAINFVRHPIAVEIAGIGPEAKLVEQATRDASVPFRYHGALSMERVPELLGRTDILVAPSITKDDGWGAVVSEALMAGAAVVTTNRVGASLCVDNDIRGRVVHKLTGTAIAEAIDGLIECGCTNYPSRMQRSDWGHAHLTGRAGADYLLAIINHLYKGYPSPPPFFVD